MIVLLHFHALPASASHGCIPTRLQLVESTTHDQCLVLCSLQVTADYTTKINSGAIRAVCGTGGLTDGTDCQLSAPNCPAGTRPVALASGNACAVCRAGAQGCGLWLLLLCLAPVTCKRSELTQFPSCAERRHILD